MVWIEERGATLREVLERRTERSALLRRLLGRIRLELVKPDIGRRYYRAVSRLQPLGRLEMDASSEASEEGSNPLRWWRRRELLPSDAVRRRERPFRPATPARPSAAREWWRRRESNPRPKTRLREALQA